MKTFEGLGLKPELVSSLAADGLEHPTSFQEMAIPVLRRGNDLLARASAGAGTMVGYGVALMDRIEGGQGRPSCLVLCTASDQAMTLARALARLGEETGHEVAALSNVWNLPERADILFVPADRLADLRSGTLVDFSALSAVVIHDGPGLLLAVGSAELDTFFEAVPTEAQRVICGLPFSEDLEKFAAGHTKKAVSVPPRPADDKSTPPRNRGAISVLVVTDGREEGALAGAADLLQDSVRHVVMYSATEDQSVDVSDFLALHGYVSGAVGDPNVPVWLATDELEARAAISSYEDPTSIATLSISVPTGIESLDRRHGSAGPNRIVVLPEEIAHLRATARAAGFALEFAKDPRPSRVTERLDALGKKLVEAAGRDEIYAYYLAVERLLGKYSGAELAAAALLLLDDAEKKGTADAPAGSAPEAWIRLFLTAGERDEISAREIMGLVTGESGVPGSRIGRIDVRESHSLVECREADAPIIIRALNGITFASRALRVDYDRGKDRRPPGRSAGGDHPRSGGGRPGGDRSGGGRASSGGGRPPPSRGGRPSGGGSRFGGDKSGGGRSRGGR